MFGALKPDFRSLATLKLVVNVVIERKKNSCGIARFPCDSTAVLFYNVENAVTIDSVVGLVSAFRNRLAINGRQLAYLPSYCPLMLFNDREQSMRYDQR